MNQSLYNSNTFIIKKEYLNFLINNKYKRIHTQKMTDVFSTINNYIRWYIDNNIRELKKYKVILINYNNIDILYLTYLCQFCNDNNIIMYIYSKEEHIPYIKYFNVNYHITPYKMLCKKYKSYITINQALKELNNFYKVNIFIYE